MAPPKGTTSKKAPDPATVEIQREVARYLLGILNDQTVSASEPGFLAQAQSIEAARVALVSALKEDE